MTRYLSLILRILFAAAGIAYIAWSVTWTDQVDAAGTVQQTGVVTMLKDARWSLLGVGLVLVGLTYPIQTLRWVLLMRCRGLNVNYIRAFRLTMVGTFFNFCMPGMTGGDLVKAYYAAKRSRRRTDAIMSIVFDRITGLLGLAILATVAGLFIFQEEVGRRVTLYIWSAAAIIALSFGIYFSRTMRKALGLNWIVGKFRPGGLLQRIDEAAVAYGNHRPTVGSAVAISVFVHILLVSATGAAGYALGMSTPYGVLLTVVPVLFMVGAIPLTYQGLGVMEGLAIALLKYPGSATANQLVGMLLLVRLYQVFYGLLGSTFLLRGDIHMHPEQQPQQPQ